MIITNERENKLVKQLLVSNEPTIRLKTYLRLLDHDYETTEVKRIITKLKIESPIISQLFSYLPIDKQSESVHVYTKWQGIHWILSSLADIGFPSGYESLKFSIDKELEWLLSDDHWERRPIINSRKRFCASQEGNGLYSILSLGLADERCDILAGRLMDYQWEDGGWNCDKKPEVRNSSYHESLIPLRSLNLYAEQKNNSKARNAVVKASELFLKRNLFRKISDNSIINQRWILLYYPSYWHYDILTALKVLAEANKIMDSRCNEALDLIESKRHADGGFPKEGSYCQTKDSSKRYFTPANWGKINKKIMNEWVTIDVLYVLKKAKRIDIEY
ncbi:MAG TPA: hypothetical protein VMX55_08340 [candidate division Zixibacteria bacterium]|nr:hypothetical protein [candidate division Zixibacteria bacterium]